MAAHTIFTWQPCCLYCITYIRIRCYTTSIALYIYIYDILDIYFNVFISWESVVQLASCNWRTLRSVFLFFPPFHFFSLMGFSPSLLLWSLFNVRISHLSRLCVCVSDSHPPSPIPRRARLWLESIGGPFERENIFRLFKMFKLA